MGSTYVVRPALLRDIQFVLARLSPVAHASMEAEIGDGDCLEKVKESVSGSRPFGMSVVYTLESGIEQPLAIFGMMPTIVPADNRRIAQLWCIASTAVALPHHAASFSRKTKRYIESLLDSYDLLFTVEDAANLEGLRWLEFLGFSEKKRGPFGPLGREFVEMSRVA